MRISDTKNQWGATLEPQRTDLWLVDFSTVVLGIKNAYDPLGDTEAANDTNLQHYATRISLPRLGVKAEEYKHASRPFMMPGADEALGEIRIDFIHDISPNSRSDVHTSKIVKFLTAWRSLVRAGRGPMSNEVDVPLDYNFKREFRFNFAVNFLKGGGAVGGILPLEGDPGLELGARYLVKKAWLQNFQINEMSYVGSCTALTITATFQAMDFFAVGT